MDLVGKQDKYEVIGAGFWHTIRDPDRGGAFMRILTDVDDQELGIRTPWELIDFG